MDKLFIKNINALKTAFKSFLKGVKYFYLTFVFDLGTISVGVFALGTRWALGFSLCL